MVLLVYLVQVMGMCSVLRSYSAQLALQVDHKSYALIFGFNTFLALILQTILTLAVADEHGLALSVKKQVRHCYKLVR